MNLPNELVNKIDTFVKSFRKEELIYLNRVIVNRIKSIDLEERQDLLSSFSKGDRVYFIDNHNRKVVGTITRVNIKSASIVSDDKHEYRVGPSILFKIEDEVQSKVKAIPSSDHQTNENKNYNGPVNSSSWTKGTSSNPNVGRNDACPCGSGKKYKKCCL